ADARARLTPTPTTIRPRARAREVVSDLGLGRSRAGRLSAGRFHRKPPARLRSGAVVVHRRLPDWTRSVEDRLLARDRFGLRGLAWTRAEPRRCPVAAVVDDRRAVVRAVPARAAAL